MIAKISDKKDHIDLQGGWPTPNLHPAAQMRAAADVLFGAESVLERLKYGPEWGDMAFRDNIADWLTRSYQPSGDRITSNRVVVTNGASNGLATILQKFADPSTTENIWMVEPSYFLACPIFRDAGYAGCIRAIPEGTEGVDLEYLRKALDETEKAPHRTVPTKTPKNGYPKIFRHFLYLVPTYSNPSGGVMSLNQRRQLISLARQYDILIVSDDVYDFLCWSANDISDQSNQSIVPRLVDIDRQMTGTRTFGNTVSNGSFSKIVAPGVRVGWLEGTPDFVQAMGTVGATVSGGCQGHFASLVINQMLQDGIIEQHLKEVMIPTYQRRHRAMIAAIHEMLYPLGVRIAAEISPQSPVMPGGFFLYLYFPDDGSLPSADEIAQIALEEHNLKIAKGSLFKVNDDVSERSQRFLQGARLCWAWNEEDILVEGIERLAIVLQRLRK